LCRKQAINAPSSIQVTRRNHQIERKGTINIKRTSWRSVDILAFERKENPKGSEPEDERPGEVSRVCDESDQQESKEPIKPVHIRNGAKRQQREIGRERLISKRLELG
jgi:hypothetical protein